MKKNYELILFSIGIILILTLFIGTSYSLWQTINTQDSVNTATTKCFNVEITSEKNNITLENAYPITNEKGKKLTPYSFTITNTCDILASYQVNLESLKNTTLASKFLDVMINNEEIKRLSEYENTDTVNLDSIESHILAKGSLGSGDSVDYTLRLWIDYDTTMEDLNNETKTLNSKVVVISQPSNWNPINSGYDTLHDAILANEYQTSPEVAIKKIEAKGTPDFSETSPRITWTEKINTTTLEIVKPSKSSINIDEATSGLGENSSFVWLWNAINTNLSAGKYSTVNQVDGFYSDLSNVDFEHNNYYTFGEIVVTRSNGKLGINFNYGTNKIIYKILSATSKNTKTKWNNKEYDSITYTLQVEKHSLYEIENDISDKGLYSMIDDYGTSYYYRGSVKNNNVSFANINWKIIRINGDGSIRMIYNGENNEDNNIGMSSFSDGNVANAFYMYNNDNEKNNANSSVIKNYIDKWFSEKIYNTKYYNYLSDAGFCNDRTLYKTEDNMIFYNSYKRLFENKSPQLTCENAKNDLFTVENKVGNMALTYPVALITADETVAAGVIDGNTLSTSSYLFSGNWFWTLSAFASAKGYTLGNNTDTVLLTMVVNDYNVRPVINLKADVKITGGIGTINDPFIVKTE